MPTTTGAAQWRLYIGPHWSAYTDPTYFDWTQYAAGAASDLTWSTTLAATVASGATSATLTSGIQFATTGGLWLGPNGSGQAWEYCPYTGKATADQITGLIRETTTDREHNGIHTAGATVRQFYPISTDDGRLHIVEEADSTYSSLQWYADISGVVIPQAALRNHHLAVVQWRIDHAGTWTNLLVGWLDSPKVRDDGKRERRWSARIVSAAQMIQLTQIPGVRAGDLDVGPFSQATGSTGLTRAYKEWHTDDITATTVTYEPAQAVDGDDSTLFISEQYVGSRQYDVPENSNDPGRIGTNESDDSAYFGPIISQIYLSRPVGEDSKGYRWIELTCQSEDVTDLWLMTEQASSGVAEFIDTTPGGAYKEGDKIIICEDEELFAAEWPNNTARVFELQNAIFDSLKSAGDSIAFLTATTVAPSGDQRWCHGVTWGTGNGSIIPGSPWSDDADYPGDWTWGGLTNVTLPTAGVVMRYDFNGTSTDSADYWGLTYDATPGYVVGDYTDEDDENYDGNGRGTGNNNFGQLYPVWIAAQLPPIGLTLRDDVAADDPGVGDPLYIVGADGQRLAGITAPCTVQIGDEQITLSALGDDYGTVSARGANSTAAQAHGAGDEVRIVDTYGADSVSTVGPKVKSFGWSRPAGGIYPADFKVYYSGREAPRPPTNENYTRDWTLAATVVGHASNTYTYTLPASKRIRHVLFVITKMSYDPARVRINELQINLDPTYYPTDLWLDDGDTAGEIIAHILTLGGIKPEAVTDTTTATPTELATATERAWTVAADMAEFTGSRVSVGRDSKIAIAPNTIFTAGGYTPATTWTRSNAGAVELIWQKNPTMPRQVKLSWRTPADDEICTAYYPATADAPSAGDILEIGPLVYPDEATATTAARRVYFLARYPYQILVEAATTAHTVRPLEIHRLTWDFDDTMEEVDRYFVVTTADHLIERGHWQTTISGQQINRESEG